MTPFRGITYAVLTAALVGCSSEEQPGVGSVGEESADGTKTAAVTPDIETEALESEVATADAGASTAGASPVERWKDRMVREAMEGVSYESGRVVVDADYASELEGVGNVEAARAEHELGRTLLEERNDHLGAIRHLTDAVVMAPGVSDFHEGLGRVLIARGLMPEAEAAFRTALDLDGDHVSATEGLASVLWMQGAQSASNEAYARLLELDPDRGEAHVRLAIGSYYAGDHAKAWRHVDAAEAAGAPLPPQFLPLLREEMPEPAGR